MILKRFLIAVVAILLATLLTGCGQSQAEQDLAKFRALDQAKSRTITHFQKLVVETQGRAAERDLEDIYDDLTPVNLAFNSVNLNEEWIQARIQQLFLQNAAEVHEQLKHTHHDDLTAIMYADNYRLYMQNANKPVTLAMEKELAQNVQRNKTE